MTRCFLFTLPIALRGISLTTQMPRGILYSAILSLHHSRKDSNVKGLSLIVSGRGGARKGAAGTLPGAGAVFSEGGAGVVRGTIIATIVWPYVSEGRPITAT